MKRRGKILLGVILIVIAGAGIWLIAGRENGSKRAVETYRQQLLAQGEKLAVSELVPIAPNGSFDNAQNLLRAISMARPITNELPAMKYVAPGCATVAWQQEILPSAAEKVSNLWPGLVVEWRADRGALTNLRAALDIPVLYFVLDYSKGFEVLLPHLAKVKQAEVLATDAAIVALHEKSYGEAWTNLQSAMALIRVYQPEPLIISHLVQIADANIATRATWEFLKSDRYSDAQLAELQADWEAMELFSSTEAAFLMERAMSVEFFARARKSRDILAGMGTPGSSGGSNSLPGFLDAPLEAVRPTLERFRYAMWKHSWSYEEELFYLQNHAAALKAIRNTRSTGAATPALKGLRSELTGITKLHTNALTHFMAGLGSDWINTALTKFAEAETARRITVTAIALRRYQLRHGNYPTELNALVPEILREVPRDLMDGKALRYRRNSDGSYLLYSVGDDGEDNNGDPTPASTTQGRNWLKGRDIVWPRPATAEEIAANLPGAGAAKIQSRQTNRPVGADTNSK